MRLFASLGMVFLACLPFAFGQGYLYPFTHDNYIYFTAPWDPMFNFSIRTSWTLYYHDVLRSELPAYGFVLADAPSINGAETCGWVHVDRVSVFGVVHGDISYQYNATAEPSQRLRIPRIAKASNRLTATESHPVPQNETLIKIHDFLFIHSPDRDIAILILEIVVPIAFAGSVLAWTAYVSKCWVDSDADSIDIELSSMKTHSTPDLALLEQVHVMEFRRSEETLPRYSKHDNLSSIKSGHNHSVPISSL